MGLLLERTRVVLLRPQLPENVGMVARSMAHFGLTRLVLAGPLCDHLDPRAIATSAGHEGVLQAAEVVPDLEAALAGASLVVGTTARQSDAPDIKPVGPEWAAQAAAQHAASGELVLLFGPERTGLTKDELRRCTEIATIPHASASACLNLAMAATVFGHAWYAQDQAGLAERLAATQGAPVEEAPTGQAGPAAGEAPQGLSVAAVAAREGASDLGGLLVGALAIAGMVKPHEAASKAHALRRIFARARLDRNEEAMIAGLARAAARAMGSGLPEGLR